ncbi:MAG: hypothetical protein M3373_00015 [Gemmatimonadota bacterium]|nr:hypothetical protein [Gemmatimonadota bacterium]
MLSALALAIAVTACGPRARIPQAPLTIPGSLAPNDSNAVLARQLAPVLYLNRDETFPLLRVVAVVHPARRVIAYNLLWRDDAHAAWIPFTIPTDQEVVWVAYDSTHAPTEIWTYWHGKVLRAEWSSRGQVLVDVQWGKHGSMPRGVVEEDLPRFLRLGDYYMLSWLLPDFWLGNVMRSGPICFCKSYRRYRDFSRPLLLASRIDAVVRTANPDAALRAAFGEPYSEKPFWPWREPRRGVVERL